MPLYPFSSVSQLCEHFRIPQSRLAGGWRLTEPFYGEINGLPSSRGQLLATDGIICLIHTGGNSLFRGHIEFFIADKPEEQPAVSFYSSKKKVTKSVSLSPVWSGF